jgi:hypothetical protein
MDLEFFKSEGKASGFVGVPIPNAFEQTLQQFLLQPGILPYRPVITCQ